MNYPYPEFFFSVQLAKKRLAENFPRDDETQPATFLFAEEIHYEDQK